MQNKLTFQQLVEVLKSSPNYTHFASRPSVIELSMRDESIKWLWHNREQFTAVTSQIAASTKDERRVPVNPLVPHPRNPVDSPEAETFQQWLAVPARVEKTDIGCELRIETRGVAGRIYMEGLVDFIGALQDGQTLTIKIIAPETDVPDPNKKSNDLGRSNPSGHGRGNPTSRDQIGPQGTQ